MGNKSFYLITAFVIFMVLVLVLYNPSADSLFTGGMDNLIIWVTYGGEELVVFKELCLQYEEQNSQIRLHVAQIPWMGQEAKYRTALIAGSPPDIGRVDTTFVPELVHNEVLLDMTSYGLKDRISELVPAAVDSCIIEDKIYGLPDQTNGACLFYNRQLFRAAGLDPDSPPASWDEFLEVALKLTDRNQRTYGFAMDNSLWWTLPFFNSYGAEFLSADGDRCILDSDEAVEAFSFKVDLYRKHSCEPGAWAPGGVPPDVGFTQGRYAMILSGPWNVKNFRDAGIDFGVALIPAGPAGTSTNVGGTNMVVFKDSQYPQQSADFLKFLTSAESQAYWADRLGQIPINLNSRQLMTREDPILDVFIEQMKTARPRPKVLKYGRLEELINPEMALALTGDKTPLEALTDGVRRINSEIFGIED